MDELLGPIKLPEPREKPPEALLEADGEPLPDWLAALNPPDREPHPRLLISRRRSVALLTASLSLPDTTRGETLRKAFLGGTRGEGFALTPPVDGAFREA